MRLNKFIAACGICSRRKADTLISDGHILINDELITDFSYQVNLETDIVEYDNRILKLESTKKYYVFRKPKDCLTTVSDDRGRKTVMDFFTQDLRLYPVGRLDFHSTGVLLITNDGDFYQKIKHIQKSYHVQISQKISEQEILKLKNGVMIDGQKTLPCEVRLLREENNKSWLEIKLTEGRNRQIRKMLESVRKKVLKLDRVKYGPINYDNLRPGEYRELTDDEIKKIYSFSGRKV